MWFPVISGLILQWDISLSFLFFCLLLHVPLQVKASSAPFLLQTCGLFGFWGYFSVSVTWHNWFLIRLSIVGVADKISTGTHGLSSTYILNQMQLTDCALGVFFFLLLLYKCEIISSTERWRDCFLEDREKDQHIFSIALLIRTVFYYYFLFNGQKKRNNNKKPSHTPHSTILWDPHLESRASQESIYQALVNCNSAPGVKFWLR